MNQVVNVPPNLELDSSSHKLGAGAVILAVLSYILLSGTGFPPTGWGHSVQPCIHSVIWFSLF